jgi:hypothetical protein
VIHNSHHMLQLQLSPQRPAVRRLALTALAVNDWAPVHDGKHALQCTFCFCNVREAHLQMAAAAAAIASTAEDGDMRTCGMLVQQQQPLRQKAQLKTLLLK